MLETRRSRPGALLAVLALALSAAACSSDDDPYGVEAAARPGPQPDLTGVCPADLVVQKDGPPAVEQAALYQLIGPDGVAGPHRYAGPLGDTGILLTLLDGGAGMGPGQRPVDALTAGNQLAGLRADLALVGTDDLARLAAAARTQIAPAVAVVAPLEQSPLVLFWGADAHPDGFEDVDDIDDIEDVEGTAARVHVRSTTEGLGKFLLDEGVDPDLVVAGATGAPEPFAADGGTWPTEGSAFGAPWVLEQGGGGWTGPVVQVYARELGYDLYPSAPSVSSLRLGELGPCLELLVPLVQQAQLDYLDDPGPVNELIAGMTGSPVEAVDAATEVMLDDGLVGNGRSETLGDFDIGRVEATIAAVAPEAAEAEGMRLTPADIITNAFVDESIGLVAR